MMMGISFKKRTGGTPVPPDQIGQTLVGPAPRRSLLNDRQDACPTEADSPNIVGTGVSPVTFKLLHSLLLLVGAIAWLVAAGTTFAHPIPRAEYDRNISVVVKLDIVEVTYRLELDPFTFFFDVSQLIKPDPSRKTLDDNARAYIERMRVLIPDNFLCTLNDKPVTFHAVKTSYSQPDSLHFLFVFQAPIKPLPGQNHFQFEEINFPDKKGTVKLSFNLVDSVTFLDYFEPSEKKTPNPGAGNPHLVSATFEGPAQLAPTLPETSTSAAPAIETPAESPNLVKRLIRDGLRALLESNYALPLLLVFAFFFGAAHALTPGHGKTLVAAYLVGEKGTVSHAVFLGIVTTVSHTGSVILIALGLWLWYPNTDREDVKRVLGLVGGIVIILLGLWILISRMMGRSDHVHLFGHNHAHSHAEGAEHSHSHGFDSNTKWTRLLILGITGGLIPCWDAILMLGIAISSDQLRLALPLLFSFSAGLAATLVAIGIAVLRASRAGRLKWQERRWMKALPIISAILVILIGISLCAGSV
jgi:ABC-type nickel/cobalt efflux system permease component RcnA